MTVYVDDAHSLRDMHDLQRHLADGAVEHLQAPRKMRSPAKIAVGPCSFETSARAGLDVDQPLERHCVIHGHHATHLSVLWITQVRARARISELVRQGRRAA